MADFVKDLFAGAAGLLTGHTPNIGTWATPNVQFASDALYITHPNTAAAKLNINGTGGMVFDTTVGGSAIVTLKSTTISPSRDCYAEVAIDCEPSTTSVEIMAALRGTLNVDAANIDFNGAVFRLHSSANITAKKAYGDDGSGGVSTVFTSPDDYPSGRFTLIFRVELLGNARTLYLNGALIATDDMSGLPTLPAGDTYFVFKYIDAPLVGDFYDAPIVRLRAGTLPASPDDQGFWSFFHKCDEVDG